MKEEWKDIRVVKGVDYSGLYQISNLGLIKTLPRLKTTHSGGEYYTKKRILKLNYTPKGYASIELCKNGIVKKVLIHRLVAQAFLGLNIDNGSMCVCHKDDNPSNNDVDNLFLGTYKDNTQDMMKKKRHHNGWKGKTGKLFFKSKKIYQYDLKGNFIKKWYGTGDIFRELGIWPGPVNYVIKGQRNHAGGYVWSRVKK